MICLLLLLYFQYPQPFDTSSLIGTKVNNMVQDQRGIYWIATDEGLNSFDGEQYSFYRPIEGGINALGHTNKGHLLLGNRHGLIRFDPEKATTESLHSEPVTHVLTETNGNIWVGNPQGLWLLQQEATHFPLGSVTAMVKGDHLWVGTDSGLYRYNPDSNHFDKEIAEGITALFLGAQKTLWVALAQGGVSGFHHHNPIQQVEHFQDTPMVTAILEDEQQQLWFLGQNGRLIIRNAARHIIEQIEIAPQSFLFQDRSHGIWMSGKHEKLQLLRNFPIKQYDLRELSNLPSRKIHALTQDQQGHLWLGSSQGLHRLDPLLGEFKSLEMEQAVHGLSFIGQLMFTGPFGLKTWDGNEHFQTISTELKGKFLKSDGQNGYWIANHEQIFHWSQGQLHSFPEKRRNITCLEAQDQGVWVGSQDGLFLFDGKWQQLNDFQTHCLFKDSQNRLWQGTKEGLVQFQGKHWLSDAPNRQVFSILEDRDGDLWLLTSAGLLRFDGEHFHPIHLPSEIQLTSVTLSSRSDEIYIATKTGLMMIKPQDLKQQTQPKPPILTSLNGKNLFNQATAQIKLTQKQGLHFSLAQPDLVGKNLSYKVQLHNGNVIESKQNQFNFPYLPPGTHVIDLQVREGLGPWSEPQKLEIEVSGFSYWPLLALLMLIGFVITGLRLHFHKKLDAEHNRILSIDKVKDRILANTSHELRTPLHGIIGLAEGLRDGVTGDLPDEARRHCEMIIHSGQHLSGLVNDILDFSRLGEDAHLKLEPVELSGIVSLVSSRLEPMAKNKGLAIQLDIEPGLWVSADEGRLQQIFTNLLGNAVKFTDEGSVGVRAIREYDHVVITVWDTGIGVAPEAMTRIFQPFEQGEGATIRHHGGAGLGLSITKRLITMHGGRIQAESLPGQGFKVTFNILTAEPETEKEPQPHQQNAVLFQPGETVFVTKKVEGDIQRILIADDETINRQVLVNHLSHGPFHLVTAPDGEKALQLIKEDSDFDLVILDVMMPHISGYEVCKRIREMYNKQELPVLMLTARAGLDPLIRGFAAGANDYLTKPISKQELLLRVENLLQLVKANRALSREKELLAREVEAEKAFKLYQEAEIRLLHAQMNPHFLQNALTNAIYFVDVDPDKAEHTLIQLSTLLRQSFNATPKGWWSLTDEMKLIEAYLEIQKVRFGERLVMAQDIDKDLLGTEIPCFLIQPLVENAVEHGFKQTMGILTVNLNIKKEEHGTKISVINTGQPLPKPFEELIQGDHALGNINRRLGLLFSGQLDYEWKNQSHCFSLLVKPRGDNT